MSDRTFNVLFLCTANSARSLMAEAILNAEGKGKFKGYSAGSFPAAAPNPTAIDLLDRQGHDTSEMSAKSWDIFGAADAPVMDFVITVCDQAAGEQCPVWPGQPMTAHWGMPDPIKFEGNDAQKGVIFARTYGQLRNRLLAFVNLPIEALDKMSLQKEVDAIAQITEDE